MEAPLAATDHGERGSGLLARFAADSYVLAQQHATAFAKVESSLQQNGAAVVDRCLNGLEVEAGIILAMNDGGRTFRDATMGSVLLVVIAGYRGRCEQNGRGGSYHQSGRRQVVEFPVFSNAVQAHRFPP
jgi:hypothetical protein